LGDLNATTLALAKTPTRFDRRQSFTGFEGLPKGDALLRVPAQAVGVNLIEAAHQDRENEPAIAALVDKLIIRKTSTGRKGRMVAN
jgi:hypothetical protein